MPPTFLSVPLSPPGDAVELRRTSAEVELHWHHSLRKPSPLKQMPATDAIPRVHLAVLLIRVRGVTA